MSPSICKLCRRVEQWREAPGEGAKCGRASCSFRKPMSTFRVIVQPIIAAVVLAFAVRSALIGIYAIPTGSMQPTLQIGDRILVTRYFSQPAERGDVVVFRSPGAGELMVKRIVAVGGDFVDAQNGRLVIGGHTLPEPYLPAREVTGGVSPQRVPPDSYFVLGDK